MRFSQIAAAYATALLMAGTAPAQSQQETPHISLELNKLEASGTACRLSFVMENRSSQDIDAASYEIVVFGKNDVINQMSVFDFGVLPQDKTIVRQFELSNLTCEGTGKLLINGPAGCSTEFVSGHCTTPLSLQSQTSVSLIQ
ncbi:hypothetical protein FIV00_07750 [Labrenzia sp. THAF82]|uniref:hypothetical protein n=1 Tax=Labrenzia sp. THAF82 TaxID=2587861 RepID=UPI001268CDB9|nr:hypothetical protein [Labrenzia sp. THAF82]QFT30362.1 hypothetical protein FIV00_07750 [Labrenzia sp. THAF82]